MATIRRNLGVLSLIVALLSSPLQADEFEGIIVPITFEFGTFYTKVALNGIVGTYLVDTGSGRTIVSHDVFRTLSERGQLRIIGKLEGHMADGTNIKGTRYVVQHMQIGNCYMDEMVIAYFDRVDQNILGMSTLDQASPFIFDTANDRLILTNCDDFSTFPSSSP